jgi:hypothetical protein
VILVWVISKKWAGLPSKSLPFREGWYGVTSTVAGQMSSTQAAKRGGV